MAQKQRHETARLRRQLDEAEERSNLLVQSSRDAIAYIHEGHVSEHQPGLPGHVRLRIRRRVGWAADHGHDRRRIAWRIQAALRKMHESGKHAEEFRCVTGDGQVSAP